MHKNKQLTTLIDALQLNFSHRFPGVIWNTVAAADQPLLLLECRYQERKRVQFTLLDYTNNKIIWRDRELEEPWWVNASAIVQGLVLFTIYLDTNNPDKKGILAYDLNSFVLKWWNNDFSVSEITNTSVHGFSGKFGLKDVVLDINTGRQIDESGGSVATNAGLRKPVQYHEGTQYFETVKTFLINQLNLSPVTALEYLESGDLFFISCNVKVSEEHLANFLLVFSFHGELLLREELDRQLTGVGLDTFFVIDNLLFFVKNKIELVSYRII